MKHNDKPVPRGHFDNVDFMTSCHMILAWRDSILFLSKSTLGLCSGLSASSSCCCFQSSSTVLAVNSGGHGWGVWRYRARNWAEGEGVKALRFGEW